MNSFVCDILGLKFEDKSSHEDELTPQLMKMVLDLRQDAKQNKDFATSDKIRNALSEMGIKIKDTKEGAEWSLE